MTQVAFRSFSTVSFKCILADVQVKTIPILAALSVVVLAWHLQAEKTGNMDNELGLEQKSKYCLIKEMRCGFYKLDESF